MAHRMLRGESLKILVFASAHAPNLRSSQGNVAVVIRIEQSSQRLQHFPKSHCSAQRVFGFDLFHFEPENPEEDWEKKLLFAYFLFLPLEALFLTILAVVGRYCRCLVSKVSLVGESGRRCCVIL
jgi:hypothetical protein